MRRLRCRASIPPSPSKSRFGTRSGRRHEDPCTDLEVHARSSGGAGGAGPEGTVWTYGPGEHRAASGVRRRRSRAPPGGSRRRRGARVMDMNKMMKQMQEMQAQMVKAQEELANETVEASAGGGVVTVKATGALEIVEVKIAPEAIDPDDPDLLADMILAAVNEALRSAQGLAESKLGSAMGGLGGLGLPGL